MESAKLLGELDELDDFIRLALEGKDTVPKPEDSTGYTIRSQPSLSERAANPHSQSNGFYREQILGSAMLPGLKPEV